MKILLPIDESDSASQTVAWASQVFDKQSTRYYLLHIIPTVYSEVSLMEYDLQDTKALLDTQQAYLERQGCHVEKAEFMEGDAVDLICEYADIMDVDQIVMGSHARKGLTKLLLGSVSTGVLERSKRPVVIHHEHPHRAAA